MNRESLLKNWLPRRRVIKSVEMRATRSAILCHMILATCAGAASGNSARVNLRPQLQDGQVFTYQIRYQSEKRIKTESAVVSPMAPIGGQVDVQRILRVEVRDVRSEGERPAFALRITFEPEIATEDRAQDSKAVDCVLHGDGRVSDVSGLDALSPEEQDAWRDCIAQFGIASVFPGQGIRPGEKWKSEEVVSGGPLAGIVWEKESQYVNNVNCPVASTNVSPQTCAVILTRASLKQKSSAKNATPDDFKLHELRTAGTVRGTNETVSYISLRTGLVVRATEEARQAMDVIVGKTDGSNRVHYNVDAQGHLEMLLVAQAPLKQP
jgi:hypothetical protein